jgi:hypothetical protein
MNKSTTQSSWLNKSSSAVSLHSNVSKQNQGPESFEKLKKELSTSHINSLREIKKGREE